MSNLFKAGFVSFDQSDARIIDNNDLSNRKIEAYQERELKRQRTRMMQEEGYEEGESVEDFVPGIGLEQIDQLTQDQNMLGSFPDPQFDMEAMQAEIDLKLQQAQEQAEMIISDAQQQAENIRSQAMEQGRQEGYDVGYQEGLAAVEQIKQDREPFG